MGWSPRSLTCRYDFDFDSAGQRCSALRVLFLQEDIADTVIEMIAGAMDELVIGDPANLDTDVGPVITAAAQESLNSHVERMRREHFETGYRRSLTQTGGCLARYRWCW